MNIPVSGSKFSCRMSASTSQIAARPVSETNTMMKPTSSTEEIAKATLNDDSLTARTANVTPVANQVIPSHRVVWNTAA